VCWSVVSVFYAAQLSVGVAAAPAPSTIHTTLSDWSIRADMYKKGYDYTTLRHRLYDERATYQYQDKRGSGISPVSAYVSNSLRVVNGCRNGAVKGSDSSISAGVIGRLALDPTVSPPAGWQMDTDPAFTQPWKLDPTADWTTVRPTASATFPVVKTTYNCGAVSSTFVEHQLLDFPIFLPGTRSELAAKPIGTTYILSYYRYLTASNKFVTEHVRFIAEKVR
jgi:hypothetical protein